MNILKLINFLNEIGELSDNSRLAIAKIMIDTFDKPSKLETLKQYLDEMVEYEKN